MTRALADDLAARRDFWLCLARAFAPPVGGDYHAAFTEHLPNDLAAIAEEIGLNVVADLDGFAAASHKLTDVLEIQRLYAALFLTPPVPVFMNTGVYMDDGFLGPSETSLNDWYARHGFERHAGFKDLNDHAAVQLEFIGLLYNKATDRAIAGEHMEALAYSAEAERFISAFPRRWITPFLLTLEATCSRRGLSEVFVCLTRIVWLALEQQLAAGATQHEAIAVASFPAESSRGMGALTAADLAEIACRLESDGLSYAHVKALPEWSDGAFDARRAEGEHRVAHSLGEPRWTQ
jgi:TorA maturation chaperone TorD